MRISSVLRSNGCLNGWRWSIGMLTLCVVTATGCKKQDTAGGPPQMPPMEVNAEVVRPITVPVKYTFIGQTSPFKNVEIRARVKGFLVSRNFEEGGKVEEGQVLFKIDPRQFEADLAEATARLEQSKATFAAGQRNYDRLKPLEAQGVANRKEIDDALSALDEARAAVRLGEAQVQLAELSLSYTTIHSPLTGVIGKTYKYEGALVDDGSNSLLAEALKTDPIYVDFSISEREWLQWREDVASGVIVGPPGGEESLELVVTLLNGVAYPVQGRFNFFDVRVSPQTGSAQARGVFENDTGTLIPGQFVKTTILGWKRPNSLTVPQRAVLQQPTGQFLYVLDQNDAIELRPVTTGDWIGDRWVIRTGLKDGDRVVVDGLQKTQPGMKVNPKIVEAPTSAPATQASRPQVSDVTTPSTQPTAY